MAARLELLKEQFFDDNGAVLNGGYLYTYIVGTTTAKATYTTALGDVEQANPVVLDSDGRIPSDLYGVGAYKIVIKDSAGTTIDTIPTVSGINSASMTTIGDYSNDFDAAITAISSTETTLYVDAAATMSGVVTVPSTCTVIIQKGGSIDQAGNALTFNGPLIFNGGTITNDTTLTMNGPVRYEGKYAVFSSTSYGTFGTGAIDKINPEMWATNTTPGTTDMRPALQAAIDACPTNGTVFVPANSYNMTTYDSTNSCFLYIDKEMNFIGAGGEKTKLIIPNSASYDGVTNTIFVDTTSNVRVSGFYIYGNNRTTDLTKNRGIYVYLSSDCRIDHNIIENTMGTGIGCDGLAVAPLTKYYRNVIEFNRILGANQDGIGTQRQIGIRILNNYIYQVGSANTNYPILLEDVDYAIVRGNECNDNYRGIALASGSDDCIVEGNSIRTSDPDGTYPSEVGIYLTECYRCDVVNNRLYDCENSGISLNDTTGVAGHVVSGNIFYNVNGSAAVQGIFIGVSYCLITNNQIPYGVNYVGGSGAGILIDAGASYNLIANNFLQGASGRLITGIEIDGATEVSNRIIDNEIYTDNTPINDSGTTTYFRGNYPETLTVTTSITLLDATHKNYNAFELNSSGGALTLTLADGTYIGQMVTIVMTNATASSTVSISHHETSDPEVATFDAVDETGVFMWSGTEWVTIKATCTFV